ncbi:unnamed protein product [Rotaria sp. Silwood1]|nr:unnamed protein product [Rotaria sp. Silwood1]
MPRIRVPVRHSGMRYIPRPGIYPPRPPPPRRGGLMGLLGGLAGLLLCLLCLATLGLLGLFATFIAVVAYLGWVYRALKDAGNGTSVHYRTPVIIIKPILYGNTAKHFGSKRDSDGHTHRWILYVRSFNNDDMSNYINRIQFRLHETYPNNIRVINQPPYEIEESDLLSFSMAGGTSYLHGLNLFDLKNPLKPTPIPTKTGCWHKADTSFEDENIQISVPIQSTSIPEHRFSIFYSDPTNKNVMYYFKFIFSWICGVEHIDDHNNQATIPPLAAENLFWKHICNLNGIIILGFCAFLWAFFTDYRIDKMYKNS